MAWQPQILVREGVLAQLLARGPRPRSQFDGILGTDVYMDDLPVTPAGRNYRSLEREVGESLDTYSVLGYESMLVLAAAMNRCAGQALDRRCVAASVRNTRDLQGVVGPIAIDDNGHALRPVVVNTIQKGRLVYLVRVN
jgi:ABC-type branched-subunit amino acid transport system substrate-binding protein